MEERGLEPDFPAAALQEAERLEPKDELDGGARDLRDLLWSSLDNDDTRDLDQLEVAERVDGDSIRLRIAIADVDSLVRPGSAIDDHARTNTTSVYTAARVFPMLPERLSTGLTSLHDGEDRLALVIEMTVAPDGSVSSPDLYPARVRNQAKLAYDAVAAWLDGEGPMPPRMAEVAGIAEQVRLQDEAASRLRRLRTERGALDFDTTETKPVFVNGVVTELREERKNRAKELIEDFMITANGVTARYLDDHGLPSIRRVVRTPKRWPRIVDVAREVGGHLPAEPDLVVLVAAVVERRRREAPDDFPEFSLAILKLLGPGEYAVDPPGGEPPGHFGLAVKDYTHATAPNRRYPDLITHRLVKAAFHRQPAPYSMEELEGLARHCTLQEDAASKVERQVRKAAAALLLESRIGDTFDAVVTGASEKGTWVRTCRRPMVEGRLERGFEGLDVGDRLRVRLVSTDVERGFIDFVRERHA